MANNFQNPYLPYPPQFYNNPFPIPPAQPQDTLEVKFIQGGSNSAKAYPVMPGKSVLLMDSEESKFFLKTMEINGVPKPIREFKYEEIVEASPIDIPTAKEISPEYVTKDDLNAALDKIIGMIADINKKPSYNNYKKGGQKNAESDI